MENGKRIVRGFLSAGADYALGVLGFFFVRCFGTRTEVVLAYHSVSETNWISGIRPELFTRQIAWMAQHAQLVRLAEVVRDCQEGVVRTRRPRIAITFDDGYADWVDQAMPILRSYGAPAIFFVTTTFGALHTSAPYTHLHPLSEAGVRSLAQYGFDIGSHSHTHLDCLKASDEAIFEELVTSKRILEALTEKAVTEFSFPKSRCSPTAPSLLERAGYLCAVVGRGCAHTATDPLLIPRLSVRGVHSLIRFKARLYRTLVFSSYAPS